MDRPRATPAIASGFGLNEELASSAIVQRKKSTEENYAMVGLNTRQSIASSFSFSSAYMASSL